MGRKRKNFLNKEENKNREKEIINTEERGCSNPYKGNVRPNSSFQKKVILMNSAYNLRRENKNGLKRKE